ncbi:hypothetical protein DMJ13_20280 [halophilic archaeon]|nr:hypothetical protein DMJ13_20280 [halophilic archaeon]
MPSDEFQPPDAESTDEEPAIRCDDCQSVLDSERQQDMAFLLLDHLTVPMIGCETHLEQFSSICGLTSDDTADLLQHQPAGGITCPGCRLAPHNPGQPMIPVQDGAIVAMACPEHQSKIMQRFQMGLQTHQQLTSTLDTPTNSPL